MFMAVWSVGCKLDIDTNLKLETISSLSQSLYIEWCEDIAILYT